MTEILETVTNLLDRAADFEDFEHSVAAVFDVLAEAEGWHDWVAWSRDGDVFVRVGQGGDTASAAEQDAEVLRPSYAGCVPLAIQTMQSTWWSAGDAPPVPGSEELMGGVASALAIPLQANAASMEGVLLLLSREARLDRARQEEIAKVVSRGLGLIARGEGRTRKLLVATELLENGLDALGWGLLVADVPAKRIIQANQRAAELLGCTRTELVGLELGAIFGIEEEYRDVMETLARQEADNRAPHRTVQMERKGGALFPAQIAAGTIRRLYARQRGMDVDDLIVMTFVDETNVLQLEEDLAKTSQMLESVLGSSPTPIVAMDEEGRIVEMNPAYQELFGAGYNPDVVERYVAAGSEAEREEWFLRVMETREDLTVVTQRTNAQGREIPLRIIFRPWRSRMGAGKGVVACAVDLTDERAAESARQSQVRLAQMEQIGALATMVTHQVRNPLTGIEESAKMLLGLLPRGTDRSAAEGQIRWILSSVKEAREAMELTLGDAKRLASNKEGTIGPVQVNEIVERVAATQRGILGSKGISLVTRLDGMVPTTHGQETQIQAVLGNLLLNALQAMEAEDMKGSITVATHYWSEDSTIEVRVQDEGPGIDEKIIKTIFAPFVTTKPLGTAGGGGNGMGLAHCQQVVEGVHKGKVVARNARAADGRIIGAEFVITLPVLRDGQNRRTPSDETRRHILVVEESEAVREATVAGLREMGYEVTGAGTIQDAISVLELGSPDVVVIDIKPPEVSRCGTDLSEIIEERIADLVERRLFTTAYSDDYWVMRFLSPRLATAKVLVRDDDATPQNAELLADDIESILKGRPILYT